MNRNGCKPQVKLSPPKQSALEQLSSDQWLLPNVFTRGNLSLSKKALQSSSPSSQAITTCNIMPFLAESLNAVRAPERILNCSVPSYPQCNRLTCKVLNTNDSLVLRVLPCSSPDPSLQLEVMNGTDDVIFDQTFSKSTIVNVALTDNIVPVNFIIVKHGNHFTLGVSVSDLLSFFF